MSQPFQATTAARAGATVSFARPCVKNWSYAPDTAADMAVLLRARDWKRRTYNLGAPHAWSLADWCDRLAARRPAFRFDVGATGPDAIDLWGNHDGSMLSWQAFEADFDRPLPHDLDAAFADYWRFLSGGDGKEAV